MGKFRILLICFILTISFSNTFSQSLSDRVYTGLLRANNLKMSFHDDGLVCGNVAGVDIRGEWNGNYYIGDNTPILSIELPIMDYTGDGKPDTIHTSVISRGPRNGQGRAETHPQYRYFWGFQPISTFRNNTESNLSQSPAVSNDPSTWPETWPDHPEYGKGVWNGLFGPKAIDGCVEAYYQVSDCFDDETTYLYGYVPNPSDSSIKGHGITAAVRFIQSTNPLINDVIYRVYDITNHSGYDYNKMFFSTITGTLMGGDGDSQDDLAEYDAKTSSVISYDSPPALGNIGQKVGVQAETVIEAPEGKKMAAFSFFQIANSPDMSFDELLWYRLMPGKITHPYYLTPMDGDYSYSTDYFSLKKGETKRIVTAYVMAWNKEEVKLKTEIAKAMWNAKFSEDAVLNAINLKEMNSHKVLSGTQTVKWNSQATDGSVEVWLSPDYGKSWQHIDSLASGKGEFSFQTSKYSDCPFGQLALILKDKNGNPCGYTTSSPFTIDNQNAEGAPYLKIVKTNAGAGETLSADEFRADILAADPEGKHLTLNCYFSADKGINYYLITSVPAASDTAVQRFSVNLNKWPNSGNAVVKLELSDGYTSCSEVTAPFIKKSERIIMTDDYVSFFSETAKNRVKINMIDSSRITGDDYIITFDDTTSVNQKYFNVYNTNKERYVIKGEPFTGNAESAVFDGMNFYSDDIITRIDSARLHMSCPGKFSFDFNAYKHPTGRIKSVIVPNDYKIVFYKEIVDTSSKYTFISPQKTIPATPVNYIVYNLTTGKKVKTVYSTAGTLYKSYYIYLLENYLGKERLTWRLNCYMPNSVTEPAEGDTIYLYTEKGLSGLDTIKISGLQPAAVGGVEKTLPEQYSLMQNYPNPFNPRTMIRFALPEASQVSLTVYNLLGEKVKELLNERMDAGEHSVEFNAQNLSSGIYFYRIKAGGFTTTRKMMLVK